MCYRRFGSILGYFGPTWQVQKSPKNDKTLYNSFKLSKQDIMGNGTTFNKWFTISRIWARFRAQKCPILARFGQTRIFPNNTPTSVFSIYNCLIPCKKLKNIIVSLLSKLEICLFWAQKCHILAHLGWIRFFFEKPGFVTFENL